MSYDLNRVLMTGRLGQKPELKRSSTGKPYSRFSLAIHSGNSKEKERATQWHQVMVWGTQAEICAQYLDKGAPILVEGYLESREYMLENIKRTAVQVNARRVQFLGGKSSHQSSHLALQVAESQADLCDGEPDESLGDELATAAG